MTSWTPTPWDAMELVGNHLWQSTLCLAVAALLTLALKRNRAQARYWIWLAASLKFLVPLAPLMALGRYVSWRSPASVVQPTMTALLDGMSQPFSRSAVGVGATSPVLASSNLLDVTLPLLMLAIWSAGSAVTLLVWWAGWRRLTRAVREASPLQEGRELDILRHLETLAGVKTPTRLVASTTSLEPGVFGLVRPALLWPKGIGERLTSRQIEALIAHEVCHLRRRDNLAAAAHMLVEALFWFHPLVWWLERRLVEERERACDEAVIGWGHEPIVYAESILRTCEFYAQSRLPCVAGITGADLKKRIEAIMRDQHGTSLGVSKKRFLAIVSVAALAAPIVVGALGTPRLGAQAPAAAADRPQFEVASIKPNKSGAQGFTLQPQPGGRITVANAPLRLLIRLAYGVQDFQIVGGPSWLNSDRFDIVAKAEGSPTQAQLGLMLRTLLSDRFKLTAHNETRDLPVYELLLASDGKTGPQLRQAQPCFRAPVNAPPQSPPLFGPAPCGFTVLPGTTSARGVTMEALASTLSNQVSRVVVDRTGLNGQFDLKLEWTPDQTADSLQAGTAPGASPSPTTDRPSIFTAVREQLGLKLESTRGPVDVLVIDYVEQPTDNQAEPAAARPTQSLTPARLDATNFCCPDYLTVMIERIKANWNQRPGMDGRGVVKFAVRRDGQLQDVEIETSSGWPTLDQAAQRAVLSTKQLPPLPAAFPNATLTVHLNFQSQGVEGSSTLEVRLAETEAAPGLIKATVEHSDRQIYLHDATVITRRDVVQARVVADSGQFSVAIMLSAQGAARMSAATKSHSGRPLAMIVNGQVVAAPTVRGQINDQVVITGDFTREEADRITAGLQQ